MRPATNYYVYVLCDPNGSPFYVGKGRGRRVDYHEREARGNSTSDKCNIIREIWRQGGKVHCNIVLRTSDETQAFQWERELIACIGRELLVNQTDGGEGTRNPSPQTRLKLQRALSKRWKHRRYRAELMRSLRVAYDQRRAAQRAIKIAQGDPLDKIEHLMPDPVNAP